MTETLCQRFEASAAFLAFVALMLAVYIVG